MRFFSSSAFLLASSSAFFLASSSAFFLASSSAFFLASSASFLFATSSGLSSSIFERFFIPAPRKSSSSSSSSSKSYNDLASEFCLFLSGRMLNRSPLASLPAFGDLTLLTLAFLFSTHSRVSSSVFSDSSSSRIIFSPPFDLTVPRFGSSRLRPPPSPPSGLLPRPPPRPPPSPPPRPPSGLLPRPPRPPPSPPKPPSGLLPRPLPRPPSVLLPRPPPMPPKPSCISSAIPPRLRLSFGAGPFSFFFSLSSGFSPSPSFWTSSFFSSSSDVSGSSFLTMPRASSLLRRRFASIRSNSSLDKVLCWLFVVSASFFLPPFLRNSSSSSLFFFAASAARSFSSCAFIAAIIASV